MKEIVAIDWETNALRSKYAREWDKWLYWWNREDVKKFFNVRNPMGLLLEYYYRRRNLNASEAVAGNRYSFKSFRKIMPENGKKSAKEVFKGLRDLQKDFEDIFNNPLSFNCLKCAMIGSDSSDDKFNMISYFIQHKNDISLLRRYARWRMLGSTHIETTEEYTTDPTAEGGLRSNSEMRGIRVKEMLAKLSEADVYNKHKDILERQLLRLNVKEYNKLNKGNGVKFDFSIWDNKSIEHIYPKSRFYHTVTDETGGHKYVTGAGDEVSDVTGLIDSDSVFSDIQKPTDIQKFSEHCIGNLVLLYGRDNSEFNALPFEEKKKKFFNNERSFDSRNLLHTISSFANRTWEPEDIAASAINTLKILKGDYNESGNE